MSTGSVKSGPPTVALAMIVRNEENFLARCLDSVVCAVDEIVIVDTGSTDRTKAIAASYSDKVARLTLLDFHWRDDFAAARNYGLDHLSAEWALVLDADEELALPRHARAAGRSEPHALRRALEGCLTGSEALAMSLPLDNAAGPGPECRIVGSGTVPRLLRVGSGVRYHKPVHEQPWVAPADVGECDDMRVVHFGPFFIDDRRLLEKHRRDRALLDSALNDDPNDADLRKMLAHELMWQGNIAEARAMYAGIAVLRSPWSRDDALYPAVEAHLALCDALLGESGSAVQRAEALIREHPRFTDARFLLGELYAVRGELRRASETFAECVRMGDPPKGYESWGGTGSWRPLALSDHLTDYLRDPSHLPPQSVVGHFARRRSKPERES